MKAFSALLGAGLATAVVGQSASEVTVTALPAPSAPSGAEPPPFSISVVTASSPNTPTAPLSSTVFVSANPPPLPSSAISPIAPVPPPSGSVPAPSLSQPGSSVPAPSPSGGGGGSVPGAGMCGLGYTYCGYILRDHQGKNSHHPPPPFFVAPY
ncbi:hypothetical protein DL546_007145 [Coniochaeta pulveracea]|uniref:Uncharacterized protein n=1 Tax=Coniochaeta pulveracea TaxID=177199 RepID=A0A420YAR1_9PEZI|nr:hypothetical protein DL546_007145 [Coniochaeta pulveracea]